MIEWTNQLATKDIEAGDEIPSISIPITLQRLVMEAGSNRDLSLIHHNKEVAQSTGASDAYMNTFFILGLFERMLREWMGVKGQLKKINSLQMKSFNVVGDIVTCKGKVTDKQEDGTVRLDIWMENEKSTTVTAIAIVQIPS
jgi:acyl dehydratase